MLDDISLRWHVVNNCRPLDLYLKDQGYMARNPRKSTYVRLVGRHRSVQCNLSTYKGPEARSPDTENGFLFAVFHRILLESGADKSLDGRSEGPFPPQLSTLTSSSASTTSKPTSPTFRP